MLRSQEKIMGLHEILIPHIYIADVCITLEPIWTLVTTFLMEEQVTLFKIHLLQNNKPSRPNL